MAPLSGTHAAELRCLGVPSERVKTCRRSLHLSRAAMKHPPVLPRHAVRTRREPRSFSCSEWLARRPAAEASLVLWGETPGC